MTLGQMIVIEIIHTRQFSPATNFLLLLTYFNDTVIRRRENWRVRLVTMNCQNLQKTSSNSLLSRNPGEAHGWKGNFTAACQSGTSEAQLEMLSSSSLSQCFISWRGGSEVTAQLQSIQPGGAEETRVTAPPRGQ